VLAFFVLGYLVLGGADLGVGMLLPYLGRTAAERRLVIAAVAPFFLGNEVWLVGGAGVLAGAFPRLEGTLFGAHLPVVVALVAGWVVRDMGLWLRGRVDAAGWRAGWDSAVVAGSWTAVLSWGGLFAGLLGTGGSGVIASLVTLGTVVAVAAVFALHGGAFAAMRLRGAPLERARRLSGPSTERVTFALTGGALALVAVLGGLRLPLVSSAADAATLSLLVPAMVVLAPLLAAVQAGVWWMFRHRVEAPSYL
jgi:cytochrome bd-type quinol oxidase subunit 2